MLTTATRAYRRAAGLCLTCAAPAPAGKPLCERHRAIQTAYLREKRREWTAAGLCSVCGRETGGHYRCPRHNARHNAVQMKTRERWLREGRCRHCGRDLKPLGADYGLTSCPVCQWGWDEQRRIVRNKRR